MDLKASEFEEIEYLREDGETQKVIFSDSQYFTKYSGNMVRAIVPTKTSKQREKFSDSCLIVILTKDFNSLFEDAVF